MLLQGRAFKGLGPKLCGLALLKASLAHSSWPWEQALWLGWGPSVKPVCAQNCCVSSRYISGRAGASGAQSAELQEPWGGKGSEWLLGVWLQACEPASQPAMSTKAALWAYFSQK